MFTKRYGQYSLARNLNVSESPNATDIYTYTVEFAKNEEIAKNLPTKL